MSRVNALIVLTSIAFSALGCVVHTHPEHAHYRHSHPHPHPPPHHEVHREVIVVHHD